MFDQLLTDGLAALVTIGAVLLLALLALFTVSFATIRYRRLKHEYDQLIATHHNTRDRLAELKAERGDGLTFADPDTAEEVAGLLCGYAAQVRDLGPAYGEDYIPALTLARGLEEIAAKLNPPDEVDATVPPSRPAWSIPGLDERVAAAPDERARLETLLGPEMSKHLVMREVLPDGTRGPWVPLPPRGEA